MRLFTLNYSDQWREVFWNLVSQFVRLLSFIKSQLEHELLTYKVRQWSKPPDSDKKASRECFTFASVKTSSSAVGGKRSVWPGHNSLAWRCGALPLITSLSIKHSLWLVSIKVTHLLYWILLKKKGSPYFPEQASPPQTVKSDHEVGR